MGGRYAQRADGTAPMFLRHPSAISGAGVDSGVEGAAIIQLPDYVHTASGDGPVWIEVTYDDAGVRTETYFYRDSNGDTQMTTGNSVGSNTAAAKAQYVGSFGRDYFADGADLTITAADLMAAAIAAGAQVRLSDGTARLASTTAPLADYITRIDIDLKPTGGHVDDAGVQKTTTASDATHVRGGGTYDIDPGGSSSVGELRDAQGFLVKANTGDIVLKAGSGMVVSFDIASLPA